MLQAAEVVVLHRRPVFIFSEPDGLASASVRVGKAHGAGNRPLDLDGPTSRDFEPLPADALECGIAELFRRAALRHPERTALDDGQQRLPYGVLAGVVGELATLLRASTAPDEAVALLLAGTCDIWIGMLACLAAGRSFAALDLHHPPARNAAILRDAAFGLVVAPGGFDPEGAVIPPHVRRLALPAFGAGTETRPVGPDAAVILYTSGSTGQPKGIVNDQAAIVQRVVQHVAACHVSAQDRFLTSSSPATISGVREGLAALLTGATLYLLDLQREGLGAFAARLRDERITVMYTVPSILRALAGMPDAGAILGSLRVVRIGGEVVFWSDIARFRQVLSPGCHIQIGFSSTEATGSQWFVPRDAAQDGPFVPIGYALPGTEFTVVDGSGAPVAPGERGELVITSRFVARGVWQKGACLPGPFEPLPGHGAIRRLRTGDLVRQRPDGLWEACGRTDRMVKINGQRIEPAEVEAFFRAHPAVADAAVIARRDEGGTSLVAFAVPQAGPSGPDLAARLRADARRGLSPAMSPGRLHIVPVIPSLPSGKPDVAGMRALDDAAPPPAVEGEGQGDAVDRAVADAWRSVLGRRAPLTPSFESAGGDSLKLLQMAFLIETRLGCPVPLDRLSADMSANQMARAIHEPALADATGQPSVVLFPGLGGDEPRLARFRAGLAHAVRFTVAEYPDWSETARLGGGLDPLVDAMASRLLAVPPGEPMLLAGYSFGGLIAYRVALRLTAAGRPVGMLALIDSSLTEQARDARPEAIRLSWARLAIRHLRRGEISVVLGLALAKFARDMGLLPVLARGRQRWRNLIPASARMIFDRQLCLVLRHKAVAAWRQTGQMEMLPVRTVLFRSGSYGPDTLEDLGWRCWCPQLRVVRIPGGHHSIFDPPHVGDLCVRFGEAVPCGLLIIQPAAAGGT